MHHRMLEDSLEGITDLIKLINQPKYQKELKNQQELINCNVGNVTKDLLDALSKILEPLSFNDFEKALSNSILIDNVISYYRRSIEMYMCESVIRLYETDSKLFLPITKVEEEEKAVLKWLEIIQDIVNDLKTKIKLENQAKIFYRIHKLQIMMGIESTCITNFKNTLVTLQTQRIIHKNDKSIDSKSQTFNNMHFHPIVQKASEQLFKHDHYAQAIFEASKALVNYVRKKSNLSIANDRDLMYQAFDIKHSDNPIRITKKPVLSLNKLSSLSEIDEQEGFCHLFVGLVVGVRNPKAHDEVIQNDPNKTLEYLSLISLLAKRTEEATISST